MSHSNSKSWFRRFRYRLSQRSRILTQTAICTNHNRIVTVGILILLWYLPFWIGSLAHGILIGVSTPVLNIGFLYLGVDILWRQRQNLIAETIYDDERLLGYLLIMGSVVYFPFCLSSLSLQALLCMTILLGIAICNWGTAAVRKYPLAIALILISVYPSLDFLSYAVRTTLADGQLERLMAWLGGIALSWIGQPVFVQDTLLSLSTNFDPQKAVEVAAGCSGFDMAFSIAGFAFMMGLYLKQSWQKTLILIAIGVALALAFNVPRIMLMTLAIVYWGKDAFEFWHGPIGGQIFAGVLFTVYYYLAMALIHWKPGKVKSKFNSRS